MQNVALIPARAGSKRIPNKNILELNGHPLIAYSISAALQCPDISRVIVSTDSEEIRSLAIRYGADAPGLRPKEISQTTSTDISWIKHVLQEWINLRDEENLIILRPTSPLRKPLTITNALYLANSYTSWDSLRAVRPIKEHPRKMWKIDTGFMSPFLPEFNSKTKTESHSSPMQTLEQLWIQDASLEICKVRTILGLNSLSGKKVIPFHMPDFEGFDINYPIDLEFLNYLIEKKLAALPSLDIFE